MSYHFFGFQETITLTKKGTRLQTNLRIKPVKCSGLSHTKMLYFG